MSEPISDMARYVAETEAALQALQARLTAAQALAEAVRRIAEKPCSSPTSGECPDYWAVGMLKDGCGPCLARAALTAFDEATQTEEVEE